MYSNYNLIHFDFASKVIKYDKLDNMCNVNHLRLMIKHPIKIYHNYSKKSFEAINNMDMQNIATKHSQRERNRLGHVHSSSYATN